MSDERNNINADNLTASERQKVLSDLAAKVSDGIQDAFGAAKGPNAASSASDLSKLKTDYLAALGAQKEAAKQLEDVLKAVKEQFGKSNAYLDGVIKGYQDTLDAATKSLSDIAERLEKAKAASASGSQKQQQQGPTPGSAQQQQPPRNTGRPTPVPNAGSKSKLVPAQTTKGKQIAWEIDDVLGELHELTHKELKEVEDHILKIRYSIKVNTAGKENQLLNEYADVLGKEFKKEMGKRNGVFGRIGSFLEKADVDATSVIGGLTSNSPLVMMGTKFIMQRMKDAKQDKRKRDLASKKRAGGIADELRGYGPVTAASTAPGPSASPGGPVPHPASAAAPATPGGTSPEAVPVDETVHAQAAKVSRVKPVRDEYDEGVATSNGLAKAMSQGFGLLHDDVARLEKISIDQLSQLKNLTAILQSEDESSRLSKAAKLRETTDAGLPGAAAAAIAGRGKGDGSGSGGGKLALLETVTEAIFGEKIGKYGWKLGKKGLSRIKSLFGKGSGVASTAERVETATEGVAEAAGKGSKVSRLVKGVSNFWKSEEGASGLGGIRQVTRKAANSLPRTFLDGLTKFFKSEEGAKGLGGALNKGGTSAGFGERITKAFATFLKSEETLRGVGNAGNGIKTATETAGLLTRVTAFAKVMEALKPVLKVMGPVLKLVGRDAGFVQAMPEPTSKDMADFGRGVKQHRDELAHKNSGKPIKPVKTPTQAHTTSTSTSTPTASTVSATSRPASTVTSASIAPVSMSAAAAPVPATSSSGYHSFDYVPRHFDKNDPFARNAPPLAVSSGNSNSPAPVKNGGGGGNDDAYALIRRNEGLSLKAYRDGGGWSVGYGHHFKTGEKIETNITKERAEELLQQDVAGFRKELDAKLRVPVSPEQYSALLDLMYNVGAGGASKTIRLLNEGKMDDAVAEMRTHNRSQGKVLGVLTARREQEAQALSAGGSPQLAASASKGSPQQVAASASMGGGLMTASSKSSSATQTASAITPTPVATPAPSSGPRLKQAMDSNAEGKMVAASVKPQAPTVIAPKTNISQNSSTTIAGNISPRNDEDTYQRFMNQMYVPS